MPGFGGDGNGATHMIDIDWPKLDIIDRSDISTTELWTIKEKIDAGSASTKQVNAGNWEITLPDGTGYYLSTLFGEVYFIRRIKSKELFSGMAKFTFDN